MTRAARKFQRAFTLLELIIVFMIIAILVAIAEPNFTCQWMDRRPMRTEEELSWVASEIAIRTLELGAPPPARRDDHGWSGTEHGEPEFTAYTLEGIEELKDPTGQFHGIIGDRFRRGWGQHYVYHTDGRGWMLLSAGPDTDYDIDPAAELERMSRDSGAGPAALTYDPTNGFNSSGDIVRFMR